MKPHVIYIRILFNKYAKLFKYYYSNIPKHYFQFNIVDYSHKILTSTKEKKKKYILSYKF